MTRLFSARLILFALLSLFLVRGVALAQLSPNVTVFATSLNNPRGLKFGPDGNLYVAEGGFGGSQTTTPGNCEQVPVPVGPYSGGFTARISRFSQNGARTAVADNLPSSQTSAAMGGLVSGVADVAFIGNQMYAILAGAGCSHGLLNTVNAILRVNANGTTAQVADLSAFQKANPVAKPEPDDFEPDGTWYSMVAVNGDLYAVEPNHGEVDRISPETGAISRVVDVSASQGHIVPTAIAYHGNFVFGNLGTFPITPGNESIFKLMPDGKIEVLASGFTTVLGLAYDHKGRLYVLESMTAPGFPGPTQVGTGKIVRIDRSGAVEPIASGFTFPTAMTFGPDGALYVSNLGFAAGAGQILRVTVPESLGAPVPCDPGPTTLCLNGGHFSVTTKWSTLDGQSGVGQAVALSGDTGYFTFFNPASVEVVVKVLNGCALNSRYWTFAGGLTNVNVILTVTDSVTGAARTYTNPQGVPYQPIQDTNAFPCQ